MELNVQILMLVCKDYPLEFEIHREGSLSNPLGLCADTYTGNACSNCIDGYAKYGTGNECTNCRTNTTYYIKLAGLFILQVVSVILSVR
jgi:hypothetical protein